MADDEEGEYFEMAVKKVPAKTFRVSQVVQVVEFDDDYYDDGSAPYQEEQEGYEEEQEYQVPTPVRAAAPSKFQPPPPVRPNNPGSPQYSNAGITKPLPTPVPTSPPSMAGIPAPAPASPTPTPTPTPAPASQFSKLPPPRLTNPPLPTGYVAKSNPQVPGRGGVGVGGVSAINSGMRGGAPSRGPQPTPSGKPLPQAPGRSLPPGPGRGLGSSGNLPVPEPPGGGVGGRPGLSNSSPSVAPLAPGLRKLPSPKIPPARAPALTHNPLPPPMQLPPPVPTPIALPSALSPRADEEETVDAPPEAANVPSSFVVMPSTPLKFGGGNRFSITDQQPVSRGRAGTTGQILKSSTDGKKYGSQIRDDDPTAGKLRSAVATSSGEDPLKREDADEHIMAKGWLLKKGRRVKNWKKRWFVLKGPKLYYYKRANDDASKKGIVHLESCVIEDLKPRPDSRRPCMALLVQGRKLLIVGERDDENRYWYLVLVCKNSELTYKRKRRLQNLPEDLALIEFLRNPLVRNLVLDDEEIPLEAVVSLSLPIRAHTELQMVSLRYSKIGSLELEVICDAIGHNKSIEVLHLEGNNIDTSGAKCLAKLLNNNQTIRELHLDDNNLGDEGVKLLAAAVPNHKAFKVLTLHKNNIGATGTNWLCQMFSTTDFFATLALSENPVEDEGISGIATMINQNRSLTCLELENCGIGERGFASLAAALQTNITIRDIKLKDNHLEENAKKVMAQTLMVNKALTTIDLGTYKLDADQLHGMRLLYDCGFLQQGQLPPGGPGMMKAPF